MRGCLMLLLMLVATAAWAACLDTKPPVVVITDPDDGERISRGQPFTMRANATDNVGVVSVRMTVNGQTVCTDPTAPYTCFWAVPSKRNVTYTLQAFASDAAGNIGPSSVVRVTSR